MADVFVSYAAEDGAVARYVAEKLKGEHYDVWYYQGDGQTPGQDYMDNIGDGVRNARVVVLFVSLSAIASPQCNSEAQIAWEESKEVIPLLRGLTFEQLKADKRGKRWADRIGTKVSISIDGKAPDAVLESVLAGLRATRRTTGTTARPAVPARPAAAPLPSPAYPAAGTVVAGVVGGLGLLYCFYSLGYVLFTPAGPQAWIFANFPTVKTADLLVNLLGAAQNAGLLYGAWLLHRRDSRGAPLIRKIALTMLAAVGLWLVLCLFVFTGAGAASRIPNPADRSKVVEATIAFGMMALVPSAIVFWLFRGARR
jgi:TIR domain-containing protein